MAASVRTLLVVASIVTAVLSALVADAGWLAIAVALFAAAHLP